MNKTASGAGGGGEAGGVCGGGCCCGGCAGASPKGNSSPRLRTRSSDGTWGASAGSARAGRVGGGGKPRTRSGGWKNGKPRPRVRQPGVASQRARRGTKPTLRLRQPAASGSADASGATGTACPKWVTAALESAAASCGGSVAASAGRWPSQTLTSSEMRTYGAALGACMSCSAPCKRRPSNARCLPGTGCERCAQHAPARTARPCASATAGRTTVGAPLEPR
mmetsp:Transcript_35258/g.113340  ORF Transcript_35258/g.113340 Transcript_35258/m.113340 type:complete len:223 (-) Transcript_35258:487-1155(-)